MLPAPGRKEMEKAGTKGEKVFPVAQMFHKHQFALASEHAVGFGEKQNSIACPPQFVGSKDQEGCVELAGSCRQAAVVGGNRELTIQTAGAADRRLGHFARIVNVDNSSLGVRK